MSGMIAPGSDLTLHLWWLPGAKEKINILDSAYVVTTTLWNFSKGGAVRKSVAFHQIPPNYMENFTKIPQSFGELNGKYINYCIKEKLRESTDTTLSTISRYAIGPQLNRSPSKGKLHHPDFEWKYQIRGCSSHGACCIGVKSDAVSVLRWCCIGWKSCVITLSQLFLHYKSYNTS